MATDLDQWRKLSQKDFTTKLLNLAEDHVDVLPEKAYIGLMNAAKVIHERLPQQECQQHEEEEVTSNSTVARITHAIIELKREKKRILMTRNRYNGFKIMKRVTQKLQVEAIMHIAENVYGIILPCASFECLEHECGVHIPQNSRRGFFTDYLQHRNAMMVRMSAEYDRMIAYIDERLYFFTTKYHELISF
tara:strand:- start:514 stop:1086 length:573 start_codon:yes stop_codon:yes gene_type:complete